MRKKWMIAAAVCTGVALIGTAGCGNPLEKLFAPSGTERAATEAAAPESTEQKTPMEASTTESTSAGAESDPLYQELSEWQFVFSSGAGGWETQFTVNPDGSFQGVYYDSDMGVTGPGYEECGTLYYCAFSGNFTEYTRISEYVYEVEFGELQYQDKPGTQEIKEGTRYVYSDAYGLTGTNSLIVYLPGTPTADLPEAFMSWVNMIWYTYLPDDFVEDVPPELPFCGLYNEAEEEGIFSESLTDKNTAFLINSVHFPGLKAQRGELYEDGTYSYEDADPYGMYRVINKCFSLPNGYRMYENQERFAKACIEETTGAADPEGFYVIGSDMEYGLPVKTHLNGNDCLQVSWQEGENEDTTYYVACVYQDHYKGYSYCYAVGYDPDGDFMTGEMANFLLMSVSVSGSPSHLSSADETGNAPERRITAEVTAGPSDSTILVDDVELVSIMDTEKMEEYGIDPEDVTNDYSIVGEDGKYDEYPLVDGCAFYVQYHENPLHPNLDASGFREYLGKDGVRLMDLYLDREERVLLAYEPYTP